MRRHILIIGFVVCCWLRSLAIVPALEREVNLTLNNEKVTTALSKIQEQTGLIFSYQPAIVNGIGLITLQLKHKTVREALVLLFPKNIQYKSKNNYIILKEKPAEKEQKKTELSGYVYDKNTDKKLANVTIYDKNTLQSVTTNEYGYYSISLPTNEQCLSVNKENYQDTCVSFTYLKDGPLKNIRINPISDSIRKRDSINWRQRLKDFGQSTNELFKSFKGYINTINVKDTFNRNFQASLIPFLGTNGLLSGNVYNKYSINIFGGYSRGSSLLELGGFFNVDREKVTGAQLAGFFNLVGDSVKGAQLAGFFNVTGKQVNGLQAAGFFNANVGNMNGVQLAGFLNTNVGTTKGFQGAGLANLNVKSVNGISAAGLLNANRFSVAGAQIAGLLNVCADTLAGASIAGLMNLNWYSKKSVEVSGLVNGARRGQNNLQISGLVNSTAKGSTMLQIATLVNRAHTLKGVQIGLFNYSDSASGVPIGLFSFVKKGLHQIEVYSDELFYANIGLRTGVNGFYNVSSIGFQPNSKQTLWQFGYGFGTSFKIKNKLRGDVTATAHHVSSGKFYFGTSELYKFYAGVEYKFAKKISLAFGPTFNLYWSDELLPDYESTYSNIAPYYSFNKALAYDFNLKGWFGAKLALRFL